MRPCVMSPRIAAVLAAMAIAVGVAGTSLAAATTAPTPVVYFGKLQCCATLTLNTSGVEVVRTPKLAAGTYAVTAMASAILGPADKIGCFVMAVSVSGNDGVFGGEGNGYPSSPTGPGGVPGTVTMSDVVHIATAGDQIRMICNSGRGGSGTYVYDATITATKVGTLHT